MRVLVVDDSMLFRKVVRDALARVPGIEVVGSAADGRAALEKIDQLHPDAITLDLEMPEIDGLEVLRQLKNRSAAPAVVVISAFTDAGAALTTKALRLGAFDFVLKPNGSNFDDNRERLAADLIPMMHAIAEQRQLLVHGTHAVPAPCEAPPPTTSRLPRQPPDIVAIGISTGGPSSLQAMLPKLPADLPVPVVIVQHMPPKFTRSLADDLNRTCALRVCEGQDGERLRAGHAYIAPGGLQTRIERCANGMKLRVTDDPPEKCCKPSVDYLFRSLARQLGPRVLGVIMTGMGDDGAAGCNLLKKEGAFIIAQDAESCVVYGMPRVVIERGLADSIQPLTAIASAIEENVRIGAVKC